MSGNIFYVYRNASESSKRSSPTEGNNRYLDRQFAVFPWQMVIT